MADITKNSVLTANGLLTDYDKNVAKSIAEIESEVDKYEDKTSAYLVKISSRELSSKDSIEVTRLLHSVGDIERISDHSVNIMRAAKEIHEKNIKFSADAIHDLHVIGSAVEEIIAVTVNALINDSTVDAKKVEPLDQIIDKLKHKIKKNHIRRLREGDCTVEMGFILSDLLTAYERIAGHCSNIAVCILEPDNDTLESHDYLSHVKNEGENAFFEHYAEYKEKYRI